MKAEFILRNKMHQSNPGKEALRKMDNFYGKILVPFVDNLIRENLTKTSDGYLCSLDDLCESDQFAMAAKFIEFDQHDTYVISDNNKNSEIMWMLAKLLKNQDIDNKLDFSDLVSQCTLDYYKDQIESLIEDRLHFIKEEDHYEQGLIKQFHKDNGESYWIPG